MSARNKLASVDMVNFEGLFTKQNPETLKITQLRECKNADFFREYGSLSKIRGNARVLANVYAEGSVKGIHWGGFYKAQDLSGAIVRQVLIGAGTTLQKIESDGSLTELLSGEPDSLFRTADQLDRFMFISSQDPFDVGKSGQMSKYDGTRITQWGVTAPGNQETSREDFDDASIFTATNSTAADTTTPAWAGTSTSLVKSTASVEANIEDLNRAGFEVNTIIADRMKMQLFIPRESYRDLATSGRAVSCYFGSENTLATNYHRYDFQIGRLFEGWNTLIFDFSTFPSGDFGTTVGVVDDSAITSIRFEIITNNATDTPTVYWDSLVTLDQGGVVPAFGDAGGSVFNQGANSTWNYKVTFVDDAGFESNASPEGVTADNTTGVTNFGKIDLSDVPVSTNGSVVKRLIYRTLAAGSEFLFLATINDNVTTVYEDTTTDIALGSTTPPILGDPIFDHSPAPSGGMALIWKRTAFIAGDPLNPTILTFSRFDLPEAFPIVNAFEFDERITGMFKTYLGIVVTTETSYWRIIGDNPDYTLDKVIEGFGGVGMRGVGTAREIGWATDRDGLRLYDLREALKISEVIRDRVDAFDKSSLEESHTAHSRKDNAIWWLTQDSSNNYTDIYQYQYMIDETRSGWFSQVVPNPTTFDIRHMWEVEDANGDFQFYAGTAGGMVHRMMDSSSLNWTDDDGAERAITMDVLTPYMRLGATAEAVELFAQSGRVVPRYIELRIKEADGLAHQWTVTVDTSDSAAENATVRDTQDLTYDFLAGQSLLRLPTQDLVAGEYMRVRLLNAEKDKDLQIMGVKIYYHVRPGQYAVIGGGGDGGVAGAGGQN